jgi:uncharacterized SAM-binding protein YcdF (DUF218 family)
MAEWTTILLMTLGIGCLCYLLAITCYCGFLPAFSWFWAGTGILFFCGSYILHLEKMTEAFWYPGLCLGIWIFLGYVGLFFALAFICLFREGNKKPKRGADYLIVLGAKVKGTQPTRALMGRIEAAYGYLKENQETIAILTGGVGKEAEISEAACMERELLARGIRPERMRKEEKSTTTRENIAYAKEWITDSEGQILVVTSDFHVKRGIAVTKDAGFSRVEGLGAVSVPLMIPHYYTREIFAWVRFVLQKGTAVRKNRGKRTGVKDGHNNI